MDFQFTLDEISSKCQVSKQSLYNLIKKNQDFIKDNSIRKQRKIYYSQAAMDFFISYYHPEQAQTEGKIPSFSVDTDTAEGQAENPPLETSSTDNPHKSQSDALQTEIDALKAEIDALKSQLAAKEAERTELLRQNGALILTLQQEKQEKLLLLPPPKKPLSEKLKSLFHKE